MDDGLISKSALTQADFEQIKELSESCQKQDGFEVKLNWAMMSHRDGDQPSDFCYYRAGQLVGYAPLDGFGDQYEVTGLVLPAYRRQGIFRRLLAQARQVAIARSAAKLLLVSYRAFEAEQVVARAFQGEYDSAEYRMGATADDLTVDRLPAGELKLVQAGLDDLTELSRLFALSFGAGEWNRATELRRSFEEAGTRYYLAKLGSANVGQIGVSAEGATIYIRGVGIIPTHRGQGYGRQMLAALLRQMVREGHRHFELDVVTANRQALTLYQSCGFKERMVYDYYRLSLNDPVGL